MSDYDDALAQERRRRVREKLARVRAQENAGLRNIVEADKRHPESLRLAIAGRDGDYESLVEAFEPLFRRP